MVEMTEMQWRIGISHKNMMRETARSPARMLIESVILTQHLDFSDKTYTMQQRIFK